jgi:hypothetical protein
MNMDLKPKILEFLYDQVQSGMIPQIRKNMLQEFEAFIVSILAEIETSKSAERMQQVVQVQKEESDEKNSK